VESTLFYRRRAAEVRAEADKVRLDCLKQQFLLIAAQYEELAKMVELNEQQP
jgi:hypothetical protein